MAAAIELRTDYSAEELTKLAQRAQDGGQARRLLALAAVAGSASRADAARIGGMDRQTLRDWVHRFNKDGPEGLVNRKAPGAKRQLSDDQLAELKELVIKGPDMESDGVVRWRCVDLKKLIKERYGVDYHERSIGKLLRYLGFSHISARPRHPKGDKEKQETLKKTSPERRKSLPLIWSKTHGLKSGSKTRRGWVRKTASSASGR